MSQCQEAQVARVQAAEAETKDVEDNDMIIVGSGPAACCAALYACRAGLKPLMFEGEFDHIGGQLTTTSIVENYLGLDECAGFELTERFREHAQKYGTRSLARIVSVIDMEVDPSRRFRVVDETGTLYRARTVIVATGARARRLGIQNEERFWNHGISGCAVCDGALSMFRGQRVAVVGGGDSAMESALFLTRFASKVFIVHRSDRFRASRLMLSRARAHPKIIFLTGRTIVEARDGDDEDTNSDSTSSQPQAHAHRQLQRIVLRNNTSLCSGEQQTEVLQVRGLFYAVGHDPNSALLSTLNSQHPGLLDPDGYIVACPGGTSTCVPGLFAAGDVRDRKYKQAITSASSGCMAALDAAEFLESC